MTNLGAKQDNLENKSQINPLLARAPSARATGNKIKRILARATGNKSKSVVADNKMKRILIALKPLTISKAKNTSKRISKGQESKNLPKIVGDIRHYPAANKEWKNSIYAYNQNSIRSLPALDRMASKTIKSYFSLTNNKKLARSERMRNLIRRRTVKRLFVSKPEIKQTSDKVNITVYTFNREKQFFLRKMYFYDRNMKIQKNIYLYKLWLKKNMLAFQETFKNRKSLHRVTTKKLVKKNTKTPTARKNKNKTYLHKIYLRNLLLKKYLVFSQKAKGQDQAKLLAMRAQKRGSSALIFKNLLKSMRKRDLIRKFQKRAKRKITSARELGKTPVSVVNLDTENSLILANSYPLNHSNKPISVHYIHKTFKNYLINKINQKIMFKLRSFNSVVKIQQILGGRKRARGRKRGTGKKRKGFKKLRLPYSNLKFKNEIRFFSFKLVSELKYIRKLFQFYFIKYILYLLDIKISSTNFNNYNYSTVKASKLTQTENSDKTSKAQKNSRKASRIKVKIIQFKNKYSHNKLKTIELLNIELQHTLKKVLLGSVRTKSNTVASKDSGRSPIDTELGAETPLVNMGFKGDALDLLYKKFENKYFLIFLAKFFKKEFLYINYYSKFLINQLKFGKFLPGLKLLISKIYAKKVELNIVNLKYPHLNTDIYTDSIATKLKRKLGLLRVMKKALNLAKLPYKYLPYNNATNLNEIPALTIHKSLDVKGLSTDPSFGSNMPNKKVVSEDSLDGVLNTLYPSSLVHGLGQPRLYSVGSVSKSGIQRLEKEKLGENPLILTQSKSLSVLNLIKYKWVSGVRLEAAGRLTRRYTAARSVFKYRYKGSLQNIDYSQKADISKKNLSTVMLRNHVKANSQYSFTKSKRRIGAFGLKAWLAGY